MIQLLNYRHCFKKESRGIAQKTYLEYQPNSNEKTLGQNNKNKF